MFNGFVNFGDIKGECTDKGHENWVMILSYNHGVTQPPSITQKTAGGRAAEEVNHSEFSMTKLVDAATPKLYEAACKGTHIPEVVVELWRAGGDPPSRSLRALPACLAPRWSPRLWRPDGPGAVPNRNDQVDLRRD